MRTCTPRQFGDCPAARAHDEHRIEKMSVAGRKDKNLLIAKSPKSVIRIKLFAQQFNGLEV